VARFGDTALYETEHEQDLAEESVYRAGCNLRENEQAQRQYRRALEELEVRTGLRR
jgi:hypothetical protein